MATSRTSMHHQSMAASKGKKAKAEFSLLASKAPVLQLSRDLQAFVHRNKNQHRLTTWWRTLSIFRRHLTRLLVHLTSLETFNLAKNIDWDERLVQKRVFEDKARLEAVFIHDVLLPKCYVAFTTVVADGRFAQLGLFLVGCLAEVGKHVRRAVPVMITEPAVVSYVRREVSTDAEPALDVGERIARGLPMTELVEPKEQEISPQNVPEKPIRTKELKRSAAEDKAEQNDVTQKSIFLLKEFKIKRKIERTKKKVKKGGDAFDDLFRGLV